VEKLWYLIYLAKGLEEKKKAAEGEDTDGDKEVEEVLCGTWMSKEVSGKVCIERLREMVLCQIRELRDQVLCQAEELRDKTLRQTEELKDKVLRQAEELRNMVLCQTEGLWDCQTEELGDCENEDLWDKVIKNSKEEWGLDWDAERRSALQPGREGFDEESEESGEELENPLEEPKVQMMKWETPIEEPIPNVRKLENPETGVPTSDERPVVESAAPDNEDSDKNTDQKSEEKAEDQDQSQQAQAVTEEEQEGNASLEPLIPPQRSTIRHRTDEEFTSSQIMNGPFAEVYRERQRNSEEERRRRQQNPVNNQPNTPLTGPAHQRPRPARERNGHATRPDDPQTEQDNNAANNAANNATNPGGFQNRMKRAWTKVKNFFGR